MPGSIPVPNPGLDMTRKERKIQVANGAHQLYIPGVNFINILSTNFSYEFFDKAKT